MGASLYALIPALRPWARKLLAVANSHGSQARITSTRRSLREQTFLYRKYLAGLNPFPVAPPGSSAHEAGYAFDMVVSPWQFQSDMGRLWLSWGGIWGPSDAVHFEFPGWRGRVRGASVRAARGARTRQRTPVSVPEAPLARQGPDWYVEGANFALGFLPGPVGWLQGINEVVGGAPTVKRGASPCPWWDPFGYITNRPECRS